MPATSSEVVGWLKAVGLPLEAREVDRVPGPGQRDVEQAALLRVAALVAAAVVRGKTCFGQ